jgi:hypothetical protein
VSRLAKYEISTIPTVNEELQGVDRAAIYLKPRCPGRGEGVARGQLPAKSNAKVDQLNLGPDDRDKDIKLPLPGRNVVELTERDAFVGREASSRLGKALITDQDAAGRLNVFD